MPVQLACQVDVLQTGFGMRVIGPGLGSFQRSFQIPESVDPDKIDASFTNGVLTVKMPKAPEEKKEVKKISIN